MPPAPSPRRSVVVSFRPRQLVDGHLCRQFVRGVGRRKRVSGRLVGIAENGVLAKSQRLVYNKAIMSLPLIANIGDVFGEWTVISDPFNEDCGKRRRMVMCRAVSGFERPILVTDLHSGHAVRVIYPYGNKFIRNRYEIRSDYAVIFLRQQEPPDLECAVDIPSLDTIADSDIRFSAVLNNKSKTHYAGGYFPRTERGVPKKYIFLHRLLTGAPDGLVVDHWDHNGLNDRMANLRVVTYMENSLNRRGAPSHSTSGIRCVRFREDTQRWTAYIKLNKQSHSLGCFDTAEEANTAFEQALATREFPLPTPGTVYFAKARNKWYAQIRREGKTKSIGSFVTREEAEAALERAREEKRLATIA